MQSDPEDTLNNPVMSCINKVLTELKPKQHLSPLNRKKYFLFFSFLKGKLLKRVNSRQIMK